MAEPRSGALPALLAGALEAAVNQALALDPGSPARMERLHGRLLGLEFEGTGVALFMGFAWGNVRVTTTAGREPDTTINGTPAALLAMLAPQELGDRGLPGSGVRIRGDAALARDLEALFGKLQPDWEGRLAGIFGDTLGYQLAAGLRDGAGALKRFARESADQAVHYFRDETGALVRPQELREFSSGVDRLRDAVARLQQRLDRVAGRPT